MTGISNSPWRVAFDAHVVPVWDATEAEIKAVRQAMGALEITDATEAMGAEFRRLETRLERLEAVLKHCWQLEDTMRELRKEDEKR